MKHFTWDDVKPWSSSDGCIFADRTELLDSNDGKLPPSGYGNKIKTGLQIKFCGKLYRLYATSWSNVASVWFKVDGKKISVN